MAETLQQYPGVVVADDATEYEARACGAPMGDGLWHGWIEFVPVDDGPPLRSPRETTQPNRTDAIYWASGLSRIYLEGALRRARTSPVAVPATQPATLIFEEPAPTSSKPAVLTPSAILDPYSVYEKGEALLRQELSALSAWHLVNIVLDYELSNQPVEALNRMPALKLINMIVDAVRDRAISRP
ncbi:MAG TPA: hypothetical protein VEU08_24745 [Vicinamibacterales bacterium]|nr:hypothetical protein [Vicinamibacterales bacterium]